VPERPSSEPEAWATLLGLIKIAEPWAVRVAATLRLADNIVNKEGDPIEDLAARVGADSDALERLMRFLVARGVFAEASPRVFANNPASCLLLDDHPGSMRGWLDLEGAGGAMDRAYSGLLETVRTGRPAYPSVHGRHFWEDLASDADLARSFASLMEAHSSQLAEEVVSVYPWDGATLVIDVGGGTGALLAEVLRTHSHLRGVLVDLVARTPDATRVLEAAGVADRCQRLDCDFFGPLPTGGDVYVLRNIIHDWADETAVTVLRRCCEAAGPTGRVLVVERVVTDDGNLEELTGMDVRMLTLFASRERSLDEFNVLAAAAGLELHNARPTSSAYWLLEYRLHN
jgi:2,7-dihydroxy-5-methyl-1-naphthoate 7-O-methyltransferase